MVDLTLKFDNMEVNTKLAEEYLEKHKSGFNSPDNKCPDSSDFGYDSGGNKILFGPTASTFIKKSKENEQFREKLRTLASKVSENAELFAQLEALIRKKSKDDVMKYDIKLILQNLEYWSLAQTSTLGRELRISLHEDSPLALLGYVANAFIAGRGVVITSGLETAVVSCLFTELCHQSGLPDIILELQRGDQREVIFKLSEVREPKLGCIGVVTAKSDLDSAVQAFLSSTTQYPWKLRSVFVQETIYESFKKAMSWKCALKGGEVESDLKSLCIDAFAYNDKIFLLDYVGDIKHIKSDKSVVLVSAFRTNKELLGLLKNRLDFVSIWSSDASESNEIAFGLDASMIWINDFGTFNGSSKASQGFYQTDQMFCYNFSVQKRVVNELQKAREAWVKIDIEERVKKLIRAADIFKAEFNDNAYQKRADLILDTILQSRKNNDFEIKDGCIVLYMRQPVPFILCEEFPFSQAIDVLLLGSGLFIRHSNKLDEDDMRFVKLLKKQGLPVFIVEEDDNGDEKVATSIFMDICYKLKVVTMNFGTIFAN